MFVNQDANWNVTSIVNFDDVPLERVRSGRIWLENGRRRFSCGGLVQRVGSL